jgi:hypothetical protein
MKPGFKKDNIPRLVKRFIKVYPEDEPPYCYLLCDVETGLVYESSGEKRMCKEHKTQIKYNMDTHRFYCLDTIRGNLYYSFRIWLFKNLNSS